MGLRNKTRRCVCREGVNPEHSWVFCFHQPTSPRRLHLQSLLPRVATHSDAHKHPSTKAKLIFLRIYNPKGVWKGSWKGSLWSRVGRWLTGPCFCWVTLIKVINVHVFRVIKEHYRQALCHICSPQNDSTLLKWSNQCLNWITWGSNGAAWKLLGSTGGLMVMINEQLLYVTGLALISRFTINSNKRKTTVPWENADVELPRAAVKTKHRPWKETTWR